MKNLYPSKKFAPGIAAALQELIGDRIIEVLPNLQNIFVERFEPSGSIWKNIGQLVAARQLGRPIVIHLRPFPNSVERLEPSGSVQEDLWRSIAARRPLDRPNAIHPHPPLNSYQFLKLQDKFVKILARLFILSGITSGSPNWLREFSVTPRSLTCAVRRAAEGPHACA